MEFKKKKRKKQNKIKVKEKKVDEYRVENTVPRPVSLIFVVVVQHCAFFFFKWACFLWFLFFFYVSFEFMRRRLPPSISVFFFFLLNRFHHRIAVWSQLQLDLQREYNGGREGDEVEGLSCRLRLSVHLGCFLFPFLTCCLAAEVCFCFSNRRFSFSVVIVFLEWRVAKGALLLSSFKVCKACTFFFVCYGLLPPSCSRMSLVCSSGSSLPSLTEYCFFFSK